MFVKQSGVFVSEIARVKSGNKEMGRAYYHLDGDKPLSEKIYVPFDLAKQVGIVCTFPK